MRKLISVGTCLLLGLAAVHAQEQQQKPPETQKQEEPIQGPTFRTGVDLVAVDVAVVDRRGRPVEDLRAPEFSVKIDGEVRRVVSAELIKVDIEEARKAVAADKTESFYTSNLTPPNGRQIIIAVDQVNIRPGSLRPVLDAAGRFLDMLSPLDQIAFVAYPEPGPRVNFTNDKLRLKRAMQGLVGQQPRARPGNYNIGVSEAIAIEERRDQIVLAEVLTRECRSSDPRQLAQCERDIISESSQISRNSREDADISLRGLQQLLEQLAFVDGPKSLILISEGLAISETNDLRHLVRLAGAARTAINVLSVDLRRGDVTIAEQPPTEAEDRRILMQGLEAIASMSRGSLYHIAGTGEPIFERLASEISAYYLLGVEQRPSDSVGDRHRIDVEVRRNDVTIRSRQAFVLSPTTTRKRSAQDSLRDALGSPFAISGLPLRVTTFAQQDPGNEKVRLVVAAQIGEAGAKPGTFTLGYILIDDQNKIAASFGDQVTLTPGAGSPNEPLKFVHSAAVDPGLYSLRVGVVDAEGRRGSIARDVSAWKMAGETLAFGDLIVGSIPTQGQQGLVVQVEPYVLTEGVAAYLELYSNSEQTWNGTTVTFEVADNADSPALMSSPVTMMPGKQPTWRVAAGVMDAKKLPPGRYVARAKIARDGKPVGVLARPFVFEHEGTAAPAGSVAAVAAVVSFASSLPKFDKAAVLAPDVVGSMLDLVEKRSPSLKESLTEARAGRYGPAALEAFTAGDQTVAAFLRGIELFTKGQLDQAATQLQIAAGPRREFFPAAFYLGALFAAAGRDQDAAGVWQIALGNEPRPAAFYTMVADARLRTGQAQSAVDILKPAYERDPAQDGLARRLGMAYSMTGRHADALPVLDNYLSRNPTDQEMLYAAIVAQYEVARGGQPLSNVERTKLRKYAAAYRGSNQALVDKYLETIGVK